MTALAKYSEQDVLDALCHERMSPFIEWAFGVIDPVSAYNHSWHIDVVAEVCEAVHRRDITNAIINIPPGYLKSICVNAAFTAWTMGHNPSEWIISVSHDTDLAIENSERVALLMDQPLYKRIFPGVKLTQRSKQLLKTSKQGKRFAGSFKSGITGKDARLIVIDDPHDAKDPRNSKTLAKHNEDFDTTISSRLRDPETGARMIIMQRLAAGDLTGHLLERDKTTEDGGLWHHVCLPVEAAKKERWFIRSLDPNGQGQIITREQGDLLHPSRETSAILAQKLKTFGPDHFQAQWNQSPVAKGGGIIKREELRRYSHAPDRSFFEQIILSWDTAQKEDQLNDPSVCSVFGVTKDLNFYLLDVWRNRVQFPDLETAAEDMIKVWKPDAVLIEDKVSGTSLIQCLRRKGALVDDVTKDKIPINVIAILPYKDKESRMDSEALAIRAGRLWVPGGLNRPIWMDEWEKEVYPFPYTPHDDQVDSLSQFLKWTRTLGSGQVGKNTAASQAQRPWGQRGARRELRGYP